MVVHGIGAREGFDIVRQSDAYTMLHGWGLPTSTHNLVVDDLAGIEKRVAYFGEHRHSIEHELDGLVVKIDEVRAKAAIAAGVAARAMTPVIARQARRSRCRGSSRRATACLRPR